MTAEPEMRLVPVEPTEAMLQGGCSKHKPGQPMSDKWDEECPSFVSRRKIWSDMLSAAPAPQEGEREAIIGIVSDALESAIPEPWEVSAHAADRILALRRPAAPAPVAGDGYATAFYEIATMLGIGARPHSPAKTWKQEMRPKLLAALTAGAEPRDGEKPARWEYLREDGTWIITDDPRYRSAKYQVRPLYAHPPAHGSESGHMVRHNIVMAIIRGRAEGWTDDEIADAILSALLPQPGPASEGENDAA